MAARMEGVQHDREQEGPSFVHCKVCLCDYSVCSGGFNDVKRHIESKKHKDFEKAMNGQSSISLCKRDTLLEDQVTRAELYFATFIAEHNLALMTADHFTKLCKVMFPDSKIALEYAS